MNTGRRAAWLAIVVATAHGIGESAWEWTFDQTWSMLVVDYVAVALLIVGGVRHLRSLTVASQGLLAGGWGYLACLCYRVFFARFDEAMALGTTRPGEPDWFLALLGLEFVVVNVAFGHAMWSLGLFGRNSHPHVPSGADAGAPCA